MTAYSRLVRASAIYDLLVTTPFALPMTAAFQVELLQSLHKALSLSGTFPEFAPMHLLFVNLLGCLVVVWSVLRILRPEAIYGLYDGLCRMLFSGSMAYALLIGNGSAIIWAFLIPEIGWGVAQLSGYRRRFRSTATA